MIDYIKHLQAAGVPAHYHPAAIVCLEAARRRAKGLLLHKLRARWLRAGKIAKVMRWEDERLLDVRPLQILDDVAPMVNITGHGDNADWVMTPDGGRPAPGRWLNADPTSDDYQRAVASNYWCPGEHPRSAMSRKAWYRRNGGEYEAWARGMHVDVQHARAWHGPGLSVYECDGAWQIIAQDNVLGFVPVQVRIGYEISNVWRESDGAQLWWPIPSHALRAPLTWSVLPTLRGANA